MPYRWSLQASIPVGRGRFKESAQLDPSLSLLLVGIQPPSERALRMLSQLIDAVRPGSSQIWIQAIGEFRSVDAVQRVTSGDDGVTVHPELKLVVADGPAGLAVTLREWRAEAHALFFATEAAGRAVVEEVEAQSPRWWQFDKNLGDEILFLRQLGTCDPVIFFRESHMSVELFSTAEGVLSALRTISGLGIISDAGRSRSSVP